MGGEWKEVELREIGRIVTGKTPPTANSEFFGGCIPFVTPVDMNGRKVITTTERYLTEQGAVAVSNSRLPAGTVMVSCIGSDMGKVAVAGKDCVSNQQINSVIVESQNNKDFVYYCLVPMRTELREAQSGGSAVPILNKSDFSRIRITLPPLAEQRAIAHILGTLDDKIELNRKMNATLEEMARALFKSWFVDFDPVRAKAEGRDTGLPKAIADLFASSFVDSELGEIPKGWKVGTIGDICEIAIGGDWGSDEEFEGSCVVICLRGVDLEHLRLTGSANPPIRWVRNSSIEKRLLCEKDILIAASGAGPTGRPLWTHRGLKNAFSLPITYSNFCKRLSCKSIEHAAFLDRVLHEMRETSEIWEYVNGTSIPNLDSNALLSKKLIPLADDRILQYFLSLLRPIADKLYCAESRTLASLRDTLLPKLISGELRVKDAEKIVGRLV